MASTFILIAAVLLCATSATYGQRIFPSPIIQGEAGLNVSITCEPFVPGRPTSNELQIYIPQQGYMTFEGTPDAQMRLVRDDIGDFTNYTFGPLTAQDDGTVFRCLSSSVVSENATINVVFEPIITPVTQNFVAEENVTFTATVTVSANPQPNDYFWEKDGQRLSNSTRISLSLTFIRFMRVLREDAGLYTLSVTNAIGTTRFSFNFTVTFGPEFGPMLTNIFNCSQSTTDGSLSCASYPGVTGMLFCNPVGYPVPTVNVVEPMEVSNIVNISGGEISFTPVLPVHAGVYNCTATSSRGTSTRAIQFSVGGEPLPVMISIIGKTDDYITVSLTYNNTQNNVSATSFYVDIIRLDTSDIVASIRYPVTSLDVRNISINEFRMSEDRMYRVSVRAVNLQGNSTALSDVFTIRGENPGQGGLSPGAIAGIVIAIVIVAVAVVLVVVAIVFLFKKEKQVKKQVGTKM